MKTGSKNDPFLNCRRKPKELSKKELSNVAPASWEALLKWIIVKKPKNWIEMSAPSQSGMFGTENTLWTENFNFNFFFFFFLFPLQKWHFSFKGLTYCSTTQSERKFLTFDTIDCSCFEESVLKIRNIRFKMICKKQLYKLEVLP